MNEQQEQAKWAIRDTQSGELGSTLMSQHEAAQWRRDLGLAYGPGVADRFKVEQVQA